MWAGDGGGAGSKGLAEAPTRGLLAAALLFRTVGAVPRPVCVCSAAVTCAGSMSAWRVLGMPRSNRLSLSVSMRSCRASGAGDAAAADSVATGPFRLQRRTCRCAVFVDCACCVTAVTGAPLPRTWYESSARGQAQGVRLEPRGTVGLCTVSVRIATNRIIVHITIHITSDCP